MPVNGQTVPNKDLYRPDLDNTLTHGNSIPKRDRTGAPRSRRCDVSMYNNYVHVPKFRCNVASHCSPPSPTLWLAFARSIRDSYCPVPFTTKTNLALTLFCRHCCALHHNGLQDKLTMGCRDPAMISVAFVRTECSSGSVVQVVEMLSALQLHTAVKAQYSSSSAEAPLIPTAPTTPPSVFARSSTPPWSVQTWSVISLLY